jgi:ABC-type sugar transport system ATPase subunit
MSDTDFLIINDIAKSYGVIKALQGIHFSIKKGEIHTILGENGAGKSTLVKIISGEEVPDAGFIELDGQRPRSYRPAVAHAMGIHMVHQELAVFENLTVAENIYPNYDFKKMGKINYKKLYEETGKKFEMFGLKTIKPDTPLASVTLAGQQMVEILRCIVAQPKVIILDEPTSGLNNRETDFLMTILKHLKEEGITILYISHRLKEIMQISDRITVLRDGRLVTTMVNDGGITENDLINNMVGRDLSGSLYKIKTEPGNTDADVVLEIRGLAKKNALNSTDLTLRRGEVLGVFGLEGSGTNKLSRMIYGLERKDTGEIAVKGKKINTVNPRNMIRENVMYLNNNRKLAGLLLDMAVTDNLSLPVLSKISGKFGFINFKNREKISLEYVDKFSIVLSSPRTPPRNLSGGNQQKVMLSMCLVPNPEILIVNEPTRGIDVGAKMEIQKFLFEIAAKGVGIIVFSSELPELMCLCDRILVMRNNSIAGELSCGEYTEQAIMRYATVGTL